MQMSGQQAQSLAVQHQFLGGIGRQIKQNRRL